MLVVEPHRLQAISTLILVVAIKQPSDNRFQRLSLRLMITSLLERNDYVLYPVETFTIPYNSTPSICARTSN